MRASKAEGVRLPNVSLELAAVGLQGSRGTLNPCYSAGEMAEGPRV